MKKNLFFFCCFLYFLNTNSQTKLFGEYSAAHITIATPENKNDTYKWILDKERYYMFFPQTVDGLANLDDKLQLILMDSNLDITKPDYTQNSLPKQYEDLNDLNQISSLINNGVIRIHQRWNLNDKQLGMTTSQDFYIIFIKNIN